MARKLDVLFVNPDSSAKAYQDLAKVYSAIEPPTWSLLLAESCRSKGFGVGILDSDAERLSLDAAIQRVKDADPRLVVMVLNNRDLNQVTWEQRVMEGDPKYAPSQDVPDFPYARYAELLGLGGVRVDKPEQLGTAWDQAFSADRPTLIEVMADPNVPPIPPHISSKQAKAYVEALLKGDPDALGIVKASAKEMWASLSPARK